MSPTATATTPSHTDDGQHVFINVLWSTELLHHIDSACPLGIENGTDKGNPKPTVKVYHDDSAEAKRLACELYNEIW